MPKEGRLIAALVLLCVGLAAADQLMHRGTAGAQAGGARVEAALSTLPVGYLGSAMIVGARLRLDRPLAAALERPTAD